MAGNLGFDTYVVADATATFARAGHDGVVRPAELLHAVALADLHGEFATIVDTEALLEAASERAPGAAGREPTGGEPARAEPAAAARGTPLEEQSGARAADDRYRSAAPSGLPPRATAAQ
jgi:hypothetical protein